MKKADGRAIVIEFDLPIVGDVSNNVDKFTVTVPTLPYGYGGSTAEESCTVVAVDHYTPSAQEVSLSAGTLQLCTVLNGILCLAVLKITIQERIALDAGTYFGTQYKNGALTLLEVG